jgi:hypothetical protein
MKNTVPKIAAMGLMPVVLLSLTSCSSTPKAPAIVAPEAMADTVPTNPDDSGEEVTVEIAMTTATVEAVDYSRRTVTIRRFDGSLVACKIGPRAINFNQIKVGDEIRAAVAEECAIYLGKDALPPQTGGKAVIVRAAKGEIPGGMEVATVDINAKVLDVDFESRRVILQTSTNEAHGVNVAPRVDLTDIHYGDKVFVRLTEAAAITVEKP